MLDGRSSLLMLKAIALSGVSAIVILSCTGSSRSASPSPTNGQSADASTSANPSRPVATDSSGPETDDPNGVEAACAATSEHVPHAIANGPVVVSGAFRVTGDQFANLQEHVIRGMSSPYRGDVDTIVDVCYLDGDFEMSTPSPSGYDNTAVRLVVFVIDDFADLFWASQTLDFQVVDPASLEPTP